MNIEALLSTCGQMVAPHRQGAATLAEKTQGDFGQLLQLFAAQLVQQTAQVDGAAQAGTPAVWSAQLPAILGQEANAPPPAPVTGPEALAPLSEPATSLTDIMAMVKSLLNQGVVEPLSVQFPETPPAIEPQPKPEAKASEQLDLATLNTLLSLLWPAQTPAAQGAAETAPKMDLTGATITTNAPAPPTPVSPTLTPTHLATDRVVPAPSLTADPVTSSSAGAAANIERSAPPPSTPAQTTLPLQPLVDAAGSRPVTIANPTNKASAQVAVDLQADLEPTFSQTAAPTTTMPTPPELTIANLQPSPEVSDIPALHQLVDSIELTGQQGKTEVQLHLQPKSLGKVLVRLEVTDGNVSVRMLAQTAQAQTLIQDHAPQLKTALAAQGLQVDSLSVNIGSDASAFDAPGHQSQADSQGPVYSRAIPAVDEAGQAALTEARSRSLSTLHSIDYQV